MELWFQSCCPLHMDSWSAATAVSDRAEGLRAMSRKLLKSQRLRPACSGYLGCCKQRVVCCGSIPLAASWGRRLVGNFCSLLSLPLFFFLFSLARRRQNKPCQLLTAWQCSAFSLTFHVSVYSTLHQATVYPDLHSCSFLEESTVEFTF